MSIFYTLAQIKQEGNKKKGWWYARAKHIDEVHMDDLAEVIQANCTVKRSDVLAVLAELTEVMRTELLASKRVVLDGFGAFKIGLRGTSVENKEDFSVQTNVKSARINFSPATDYDAATSKRTIILARGASVKHFDEV